MTLTEAQDMVEEYAPHSGYAETYRAMEDQYLPQICDVLSELQVGRAIDVGPGWGTMATWLSGNGWEVEVCDFVPQGHYMVSRLLKRANLIYHQHSIFKGPPPTKPADLLLMTQVLPHLKYRADRAIANCHAALKPGGLCCVAAINGQTHPLPATYGLDWKAVPEYATVPPEKNSVTVMYSPESLRELLQTSFRHIGICQLPKSATMLATCVRESE